MVDAQISSKISKLGFVAAVLVVMIHADVQEGCPESVRLVKDLVTGGVCGLAVPFFFAVSGYLLAGHAGEAGWWGSALKKRVWSLLVPYLIWNVVFFVADIPRSGASAFGFATCLGLNPFEMPGVYPLWFVRSLMILVVISPVLVRLVRRQGWRFCALLWVVGALIGLLLDKESDWTKSVTGLIPLTGGIFYFCVGVLLRVGNRLPCVSPGWAWSSLAGGLALTFAGVGMRWSGCLGGADMMCRIGVPLALVGTWVLCPERPWPKWLVSCSFPVFALHVFALGFFNVVIVREVNAVGVFFAKCAVAVLLPMAFAVLIRRFAPPVARLLFGGR